MHHWYDVLIDHGILAGFSWNCSSHRGAYVEDFQQNFHLEFPYFVGLFVWQILLFRYSLTPQENNHTLWGQENGKVLFWDIAWFEKNIIGNHKFDKMRSKQITVIA